MLNILIDGRALADPMAGGVPRVAKEWILDYKRNNPDNKYFCVTTGLKPSSIVDDFCQKNGFEYLHIRIPNKLWTLFSALGLVSLDTSYKLKVTRVDLVLLPNLGFVGHLKTPYEVLMHDLGFVIEPKWFTLKSRLWHKLIRVNALLARAQKIYAVSQQTAHDITRIYQIPDTKIQVFKFNPVILSAEPSKPSWIDGQKSYVLILGGADPRKNAKTALTAVTQYNLAHPNQCLIPIVLGAKQGQCKNCISPGNISDAELAYLYQNVKALLYPSWYEGFGLPLHEAHHFNTPCISSTAGALPETAPLNTIFCHPAKIHEWISALEELMRPNRVRALD